MMSCLGQAEFEVTGEWSRGDVQQAAGYENLKQEEGSINTNGRSLAYGWQLKTHAAMRWASEKG